MNKSVLHLNAVLRLQPNELDIDKVDIDSKQLTFRWSPVGTNCSADVHYNISTANCGSCPTTTNHTTVTCTDVPINGSVCTFSVQVVFCDTILGNLRDVMNITLDSRSSQRGLYNNILTSKSVWHFFNL